MYSKACHTSWELCLLAFIKIAHINFFFTCHSVVILSHCRCFSLISIDTHHVPFLYSSIRSSHLEETPTQCVWQECITYVAIQTHPNLTWYKWRIMCTNKCFPSWYTSTPQIQEVCIIFTNTNRESPSAGSIIASNPRNIVRSHLGLSCSHWKGPRSVAKANVSKVHLCLLWWNRNASSNEVIVDQYSAYICLQAKYTHILSVDV